MIGTILVCVINMDCNVIGMENMTNMKWKLTFSMTAS